MKDSMGHEIRAHDIIVSSRSPFTQDLTCRIDGEFIHLKLAPDFRKEESKMTQNSLMISSWIVKYLYLADLLEKLQATKNEGRGISCVRTLIFYLRRREINKARLVYDNDGDKICTVYPDIDEIICKGLNIKPRYENCGWK